MAIIDSLNQLETNIANAKQTLVDNMNAKGVSVTTADTLTDIAKKVSDISQGSGGGLDFSVIGYDETPDKLVADLNYSKDIYDNWDASVTNREDAFKDDTKLVFFPNVDTSNVTTMENMFSNCSNMLSFPTKLNTSNVTNMNEMFYSCKSLTNLDLSNFDTSKVTDMSYMFAYSSGLTSLDVSNFNTSKVTHMGSMFINCSGLTILDLSNFDTSNVTMVNDMFTGCGAYKVIGKLNTSKFRTSSLYNKIFGTSNSGVREITFESIGYQSGFSSWNLTGGKNWGVNSDEAPNAKQSLIDSLITYSFDRATAGYSTCTITLSANTKAVLSEDEIAQITAKGFTIA